MSPLCYANDGQARARQMADYGKNLRIRPGLVLAGIGALLLMASLLLLSFAAPPVISQPAEGDPPTVIFSESGALSLAATLDLDPSPSPQPVGRFPDEIVVNPTTGRAYVGAFQGLWVIERTGTRLDHLIPLSGTLINDLAVNPVTNRIYATDFASKTLSVIDGISDQVIAVLPVGDQPRGIAVDTQRNLIYVTAQTDRLLLVLDGNSHALLRQVSLPTELFGLAVDSVGNRLFVGACHYYDPGTYTLYALEGDNFSVLSTVSLEDCPISMRYAPQDNRLYVLESSRGVRVVDTASYQLLNLITVPNFNCTDLALDIAQNRLYLANFAGNLAAFDAQSGALLTKSAVGRLAWGVDYDAASGRVYVARGTDSVLILDQNTLQVKATVLWRSILRAMALNPQTNRLYVASGNGAFVYVVDASTRAILARIPTDFWPEEMFVDTTLNRLYVANADSRTLTIVDLSNNQVIAHPALSGEPLAITGDGQGNRVYVSLREAGAPYYRLVALDARSAVVVGQAETGDGVVDMVIDPVGRRLYLGRYAFANVRVLHADTLATLSDMPVSAHYLALDTSGPTLFAGHRPSGPRDATYISVLDGATNALRADLRGSAAIFNDIAYDAGLHRLYLSWYGGISALDAVTYRWLQNVPLGDQVSTGDLLADPVRHLLYALDENTSRIYILSDDGSTPPPAVTWYFAEGCTANPFDTWLLLQNPLTSTARATVAFMKEDGTQVVRYRDLPPVSRSSIFVDQEVPNSALSTRVDANLPIYAERAMYFGHDGHASIPAGQPSKTWYFAEGYTGPGFDTWILVQNPNQQVANVTVRFMKDNGQVVTRSFSVGPTARRNVWADEIVPDAAFGAVVEADLPIVAERAMYFGDGGGHGQMGSPALSKTWYFAEGYSGEGWDTWFLLLNPGAQPAQVTLTFLKENGTTVKSTVTVGVRSRLNVWADQIIPNATFGAMIVSTQPSVAERAMYFGKTANGGHASTGATKLARTWYLPEGSTNAPFKEALLLANPNSGTASVKLTFSKPNGQVVTRQVSMKPWSRYTLSVNLVVPNSDVSTRVDSSLPIVAERVMYFQDGNGGTATIGFAQ